jgi:hypothetical protein
MNKRNWIVGTAALALGIAVLAAPVSRAEEEKKAEGPRWDHSFKGHEMWSTKVEEAIALGAKEGRPVLVDFYKQH